MKHRSAKPVISASAQATYDDYARYLTDHLDLRPATIRNYLSDMQQFMAWFEESHDRHFAPSAIAVRFT